MSPRDRFALPAGVERALLRVLEDEARAREVAGDLEEMARRRRPRLPALFYWRHVALLAVGLGQANVADRARASAGPRIADLRTELRQTVRGLMRRPGPSLTVVVTLGIAIGFNAAVFAVLEAIVLKPLPFPEADRLVVVDEVDGSTGAREDISGLDLLDFRRETARLSGLAGWRTNKVARTSDEGPPESLNALYATEELFDVLRVPAELGRAFLPGDGGIRRVVVSSAYWSGVLGADLGVVGTSLVLDGQPYEVLGVMPPGFRFPEPDVSVWIPVDSRALEQEPRGHRTWNAVGRLAPEASAAEAQAELSGLIASLAEDFPENEGWDVSVRDAGTVYREAGNLPLLLFGAVAVVLLIACVNAANILFVRALERTPDAAIRAALGASRGRLARFVLTEALVLAAAAGALGIGASTAIVRLLQRLDPGVLPNWNEPTVDWGVALFSLAAAGATALLAGALPALHVARPGLGGTLGALGTRFSRGRMDRSVRNVLVTAQVALTLVLVHGAGLLAWSLYSVSTVDPGFDRIGILTATAVLRGSGNELTLQYDQIMERVHAIPGVLSAGTISSLPMNPVGANYHVDAFSVEFPERTPPSDRPEVEIRIVSPGYLETLGIPLVDGRELTDADRAGQPVVTMVNETLARRFYADGDAVGRHIAFGAPNPPGLEIVGVVADVKHDGLDAEPRPEVYLGFLQAPHNDMTFAVRTAGDPTSIVPAVRRAVAEVAPDIPLVGVNTVDAVVDGSLARRRFDVAVFGSVAALAVVLAVLGIYGVTSYAVSLRHREIGIRQAVGAGRGDLLVSVLGSALGLVGAGALVGAAGALLTSRYLEAQLFGVDATSAAALGAAAVGVVLIGLVGCWVPARRATRVDPVRALRA